jgi:hypothetical protein
MVDCEEHVIENPLSGERIVIRTSGAETGGTLFVWDLELAPGGRVPSSHSHPEQEERFSVVSGQMRFRVGGRAQGGAGGRPCCGSPRQTNNSPSTRVLFQAGIIQR